MLGAVTEAGVPGVVEPTVGDLFLFHADRRRDRERVGCYRRVFAQQSGNRSDQELQLQGLQDLPLKLLIDWNEPENRIVGRFVHRSCD